MLDAWVGRLTTLLVLGLLGACSGGTTNPEPHGPRITLVSGDGQLGLPSTVLPQSLQVRVEDGGAPLAGVAITWTVTRGDGGVAVRVTSTGADGVASATLQLGPGVGLNEVVATGSEIPGEVRFTATATLTPPTVLVVATVPIPANYGHHDTFVRDGLAFVSAWNSGMYIYDVGNGIRGGSPTLPVLVTQFTTSSNGVAGGAQVHNAWWFHNPVTGEKRYLFIGQEGPATIGLSASGDLHVVDISDLTHPVEVASLRIDGAGVHNFWMDEPRQVLYAAFYNAGVVAIDVSGQLGGSLTNRIIARGSPGGAGAAFTWGVALGGNTLYASDMLNGLWAFDKVTLASKQASPTITDRFTSDLAVRGSVAYTGTWGTRSGQRGNVINIFTLGASGAPTLAGSVELPGITTVSDIAISPDGTQLIATGEGGSTPGLYVFDRTDPLHPVQRAEVTIPSGLHTGEVATIGGRTYVFGAKNPPNPALLIFDITDVIP